ncbi:accessory gene regulator B [Clostridium pasteurianum DSM 525 = ATCC 6013]|uniref:Accessory gene regulator B n=1 Tax=Clostridium pasteurianum DSM 525 = ATCC 6013 TaxID=1262449 RepID=A0A0H3J6I8_CLOPA|nr:accessory gene regulator B [Clostridium pasteurianum DSM 525 = ATCC 6013]AJA50558.1 accessory gene regulator B [Clostridium pasteurianum DSM 525 = ATCC 6013]KRU13430.1 Accessory protein regulator B [Clostridium pasteurianum DSM 525 = ATCC 6013]
MLNYCIVAVVSFGILRTFASGVHTGSNIKCILMNYIIFLGNIFLSLRFSLRGCRTKKISATVFLHKKINLPLGRVKDLL